MSQKFFSTSQATKLVKYLIVTSLIKLCKQLTYLSKTMVTEKLNVKQIGSTRISVPRDHGSNTRGGENLLYLPTEATVHLCMKYSVDIYVTTLPIL